MTSADPATTTSKEKHEHARAVRRAAEASFIGNFIEWFDYASYGYLAIVIGQVFFPDSSPTGQRLAAFAVFAISFILRPIGAVVWGILGDRLGRRWALSWSILIMSGATFCIGILPGHHQIGVWAAVALVILRMFQGFSASGEYAGAGTFLAEYAPPSKRGIYVSLVPASTASGLLMGSLFVAALHALLDADSMVAWGWRIPFLLAGPLGLVGRYIRVHLEDSPAYQALVAESKTKQAEEQRRSNWTEPLRELLAEHRQAVIACFLVSCLNAVAFYMLLTYMPTYVHETLGYSESSATLATSVTLVVYIAAIFFMGHVSDIVGRRRILSLACVAFIVSSIPLFHVMSTGSFLLVIACEIVFAIILTANDGTLASFLAESFPTSVRYSGFALSFNLANTLLGGTSPYIAEWLILKTGSANAPAYYLAIVSAVALAALLFLRWTPPTDLESSQPHKS